MAEEENKVEPVLLPPETDPAEVAPAPAPAAPAPTPEEPASKGVEWALAIAMMSVLALIFYAFLSFMR